MRGSTTHGLEFLCSSGSSHLPLRWRHVTASQHSRPRIFPTEAAHLQEGIVRFGNPILAIEENDANRLNLECLPETILALAQRLLSQCFLEPDALCLRSTRPNQLRCLGYGYEY